MKIQRFLLSLAAATCLATPAFATPISFNIDTISFKPGPGYGKDSEDLLDVAFASATVPGPFALDLAGVKTWNFNVGTIKLNEACINPSTCPGTGQENDGLDVTVTFHFADPFSGNRDLSLVGTAKPGPVLDTPNEKEDYTLTFATQEFAFGSGGAFSVSMNPLSFSTNTEKTLQATITLLNAPLESVTPGGDVPEPASLALMGLGLLGIGYRAKRRKA